MGHRTVFRGCAACSPSRCGLNRDARLVLARDRMGIKPLYIARRGDELYFGSELKSIFVHPEIEPGIESGWSRLLLVAQLRARVRGRWWRASRSCYPGHWLEWRDGKVCIEAYWTLPRGPERRRTLAEARQELDSLLKQSVREHLVSDVPLGLWLSGGIDSSTLLHYAAEASSSRLKTFSISFRGYSFDETAQSRQIATRYGTEHTELDLNRRVAICRAPSSSSRTTPMSRTRIPARCRCGFFPSSPRTARPSRSAVKAPTNCSLDI